MNRPKENSVDIPEDHNCVEDAWCLVISLLSLSFAWSNSLPSRNSLSLYEKKNWMYDTTIWSLCGSKSGLLYPFLLMELSKFGLVATKNAKRRWQLPIMKLCWISFYIERSYNMFCLFAFFFFKKSFFQLDELEVVSVIVEKYYPEFINDGKLLGRLNCNYKFIFPQGN